MIFFVLRIQSAVHVLYQGTLHVSNHGWSALGPGQGWPGPLMREDHTRVPVHACVCRKSAKMTEHPFTTAKKSLGKLEADECSCHRMKGRYNLYCTLYTLQGKAESFSVNTEKKSAFELRGFSSPIFLNQGARKNPNALASYTGQEKT